MTHRPLSHLRVLDFGHYLAGPMVGMMLADLGAGLARLSWRQWRLVISLFAAAFLLQVAGTYAGYVNMKQENLELRRQIEAAYRSAVPQGRLQDAEAQLRNQLRTLRGSADSVSFMSLMDRIGRVIQKEPGTQLASVNFSDKLGEVRMNLIAPDFRTVEAIRAGMVAAGLDAETENSNAQGDAVRARLRVGEKP